MSAILSYLSVIVIWATTPLAIKWSHDSVTPVAALVMRLGLALLCGLLIVGLWRRRRFFERNNFKSYGLASISLFPNMLLVYYASTFISSGLVAVMFGLSPIVTNIFAYFMLGERFFSLHQVLSLCLAIMGLVIISFGQLALSDGESALLGILLMLGSVSLYSYSLVAVKRRGLVYPISAFDQSIGAMLFALPGVLVTWFFLDGDMDWYLSTKSMMATVYLALIGSLLGFLVFYFVLSVFSVGTVSLIPMMTPVLALWLGAVFADESISVHTVFGTLLIVSGLALLGSRSR